MPQTLSDSEMILAAIVTGAHGVTGNVRLKLVGDNPAVAAQTLQQNKTVQVSKDDGEAPRTLTLLSLRKQTQPKGAWIAHFKETASRTDAETLLGCSVYVPEAGRAPLPKGEYYVDQLRGLLLVTEMGHDLGRLADVLHTPAHDVYVCDTGVMVPAVSAFLVQIDLDAGRIVVRDVPGLRD